MPIASDVIIGPGVRIFQPDLVNLYGCSIGADTKVGAFVEIQKNVSIGERCKISSHTFICEGVVIEDECFVGHGVMFTNDVYPRAVNEDGSPQTEADWKVVKTVVKKRASIGSKDRKSTRLNSSHLVISYAVFCLKKKNKKQKEKRTRADHNA